MKLTKFPVITDGNNKYLIKIINIDRLDIDYLTIDIYKEKQKYLFFRYKHLKKCTVNSLSEYYTDYLYNLKQFAIDVISSYENTIKEKELDNKIYKELTSKSIHDFNEWDGMC